MSGGRSKTYNFQATQATRQGILLQAALCGVSGGGKTRTALILATHLVKMLDLGNPGEVIYGIDTENGSMLKYAPSKRSTGYAFQHVPMPTDDQSPDCWMAALDYCDARGAKVVILDSISSEWIGIEGVIEQVDKLTKASSSRNAFSTGWKEMSPKHSRLLQRIRESSAHVIMTVRAKTEWVLERNADGKTEPRKVGLAPVQREGIEYEPDLWFDMAPAGRDVIATVGKTRCDMIALGETFRNPDEDLARVIADWILDSPIGEQPRSVGEAVQMTIAKCRAAAALPEDERKAAMEAAFKRFEEFCRSRGVSGERFQGFRESIRAAIKSKGAVDTSVAA